jgi:hypothetical protein
MRLPHRHPAVIQNPDNARREQRPQLLTVGIRMPQIANDIPAAAHKGERLVLAHPSLSLSCFNRASIKSISDFAVLIPDVDFF